MWRLSRHLFFQILTPRHPWPNYNSPCGLLTLFQYCFILNHRGDSIFIGFCSVHPRCRLLLFDAAWRGDSIWVKIVDLFSGTILYHIHHPVLKIFFWSRFPNSVESGIGLGVLAKIPVDGARRFSPFLNSIPRKSTRLFPSLLYFLHKRDPKSTRLLKLAEKRSVKSFLTIG